MKKLIITALLFTAVLSGCNTGAVNISTSPPTTIPGSPTVSPPVEIEAKIKGNLTYLIKMALPTGAVVNVRLVDMLSSNSAPVAEQTITTTGQQVPIPFEIRYARSAINLSHPYAVQASIIVDGGVWFTGGSTINNATEIPASINLVLTRLASPETVIMFENVTWELQSYGQPGNLKQALSTTNATWQNAKVTILFDSAKGQVSGSAGINRYGGSYVLKDNTLTLPGQLISTLMAGPQPLMDQETEFLRLLQAADSYQIKDGKLQINCGQQVLIFTR